MVILCPAEAAVERLTAAGIARLLPVPLLDDALAVAPAAAASCPTASCCSSAC